MTKRDIKRMIDLAKSIGKNGSTKEQALQRLVNAGIMDKKGNFTKHYPALAAFQKEQRCIAKDQI